MFKAHGRRGRGSKRNGISIPQPVRGLTGPVLLRLPFSQPTGVATLGLYHSPFLPVEWVQRYFVFVCISQVFMQFGISSCACCPFIFLSLGIPSSYYFVHFSSGFFLTDGYELSLDIVETSPSSVLYVNNKSPWSAACLSFLFMNRFATWTCHFHGQMFQSSEWLWARLASDSTVMCADLFVSRLSDSEKLEGRDCILFMSSGTHARLGTEFVPE